MAGSDVEEGNPADPRAGREKFGAPAAALGVGSVGVLERPTGDAPLCFGTEGISSCGISGLIEPALVAPPLPRPRGEPVPLVPLFRLPLRY